MLVLRADQHVATRVEEVYARVCASYFAYQPIWDPAILEIIPDAEDEITTGSTARVVRLFRSRTEHGRCIVERVEPTKLIVVSNQFERNAETRTIECTQLNGGGTRLHVEIASEIRGIARMIAPLTTAMLERALEISLRSVKLTIESEVNAGDPTESA